METLEMQNKHYVNNEETILRKGERIIGGDKEISVSIDSILPKGEFVIPDKAYELIKYKAKKEIIATNNQINTEEVVS
jgi:hypothetical protein